MKTLTKSALSVLSILLTIFLGVSIAVGAVQTGAPPQTAPSQPPASAAGAASLRPSPSPRATASPVPTPTPAPKPKAYTIAWMSDTQRYSSSYPDTFHAMTAYLARERESLNLGYVVHTGDIVGTGSKKKQWKTARAAMDTLGDIPYGVLPGNHDRGGGGKGSYTNYSKYFGESKFADRPHYGGGREDNRDHYDLITLEGTDFVFVYLGYEPGKKAIAWANEIFRTHAERVGVLCVHDYLNAQTKLRDMGKRLQREVVATNPNVFMVLCGHRYTEDTLPATFDDDGDGKPDRTVYQSIANYQNGKDGGQGYMRFLTVDGEKGVIRYHTYSPVLDKRRSPPKSAVTQAAELPIPWLDFVAKQGK